MPKYQVNLNKLGRMNRGERRAFERWVKSVGKDEAKSQVERHFKKKPKLPENCSPIEKDIDIGIDTIGLDADGNTILGISQIKRERDERIRLEFLKINESK